MGNLEQPEFLKQETLSTCAPAIIRKLLSLYGIKKTEVEIMGQFSHLADIIENEGLPNDTFTDYLRQKFFCEIGELWTIDEIRQAVRAGAKPVVNFVTPYWEERPEPPEDGRYPGIGEGEKTDGHYALVVDFEGNDVILYDPILGPEIRMNTVEFEKRWHARYSSHEQWAAVVRGIREEATNALEAVA